MAKDRVPDSCCVNVTVGCGNDFKKSAIHTQVGGGAGLGTLGNISGGRRGTDGIRVGDEIWGGEGLGEGDRRSGREVGR